MSGSTLRYEGIARRERVKAGIPLPSGENVNERIKVPLNIYVASLWRNLMQQGVVFTLRAAGYSVYDFKHPGPGNNGFHWSEIDPKWKSWTPDQYKAGLAHRVADKGFISDMEALEACDVCVLVLPCGRSAHIEAGHAVGSGKQVIILLDEEGFEPELMYLMVGYNNICTSLDEVLQRLEIWAPILLGRKESSP